MYMDPMHDSVASEIKAEDNSLIIVYDNLDEGVLTPYYKNKKLTIKYELEYCEAEFSYRKNKTVYLDVINNAEAFKKLTENCKFISYRFSLDSFGELNLEFSIMNKNRRYKYYYLNIMLHAQKITYFWE